VIFRILSTRIFFMMFLIIIFFNFSLSSSLTMLIVNFLICLIVLELKNFSTRFSTRFDIAIDSTTISQRSCNFLISMSNFHFFFVIIQWSSAFFKECRTILNLCCWLFATTNRSSIKRLFDVTTSAFSNLLRFSLDASISLSSFWAILFLC
jgi:hypothetical protein